MKRTGECQLNTIGVGSSFFFCNEQMKHYSGHSGRNAKPDDSSWHWLVWAIPVCGSGQTTSAVIKVSLSASRLCSGVASIFSKLLLIGKN